MIFLSFDRVYCRVRFYISCLFLIILLYYFMYHLYCLYTVYRFYHAIVCGSVSDHLIHLILINLI